MKTTSRPPSRPATRAQARGLFALTLIGASSCMAQVNPCDPLSHGAVADGTTDNAVSIQAAIDACAALGGGIVPFDRGTFLTGPVQLKSHITLRLNAGATILGTLDKTQYVPAYIGTPYRAKEALISSTGATDVAIIGSGTIDGQGGVVGPDGKTWYNWGGVVPNPFPYAPSSNGTPRPWLVEFWNTNQVILQGVTTKTSPMWGNVPRYASFVIIAGISTSAPATGAANTDAIDLVSTNNATVSNVTLSAGDDAVAIKSGLPAPFQDPAQPMPRVATQSVTIANSVFTSGHGMSIGSEADGGVNDVLIQNVALNNSAGAQSNGLRLKTGRDRGSVLKNITVSNLTSVGVVQPLVINSYYPASAPPTCCTDPAQPITATTPFISNLSITDLYATGATGQSFISGLPESPVLNVTLKNVKITQTSSSIKAMDLRYLTGSISNTTVSPTASGQNFIVDAGVVVTVIPPQVFP